MTIASLIAPAMLYLQYLQGDIRDAPIIATAAALMFLLVLARVHGLIGAQRAGRGAGAGAARGERDAVLRDHRRGCRGRPCARRPPS